MSFVSVVLWWAVGCAKAPVVVPKAPSQVPVASGVEDPVPGGAGTDAPSLDLLQQWLVGRFDSSAQAESDERYFDVSLTVCPVAWSGAERALYVEQAITKNRDKPYRQRLYVLTQDGDTYRSQIYELADSDGAVGLCDRPEGFDAQTEARVLKGCGVALRWTGEAFEGTTDGRSCTNTWGDAAYATSEVRIHRDGVLSWDRGYDDAGSQVWGAEAGPYAFIRLAGADR